MKRIILLLTAIAAMITSALGTLAAGGVELPLIPIVTEFIMGATDAQCSPGGTFDITVSVTKTPGLKKLEFHVECPPEAELTGATQGMALEGLTMTRNANVIKFEGTSAATATGEAVTLSFKMDRAANKSEYSIVIRATELLSGSSSYVAGTTHVSKVTLVDVMMGDCNNDGAVDLKDVTSLRRYLAGGYGVVLQEAAADVNGDGFLDLKDVTYIRRALAGGYGIELEKTESYTVVGTENYGKKTGDAGVIALAETGSSSYENVKLSDIRLDKYSGKTDDLINFRLDVTTLGEKMTKADITTSVRDIISIVPDGDTAVLIDGKKYTASDIIPFCNLDGSKRTDITVFNSGKKLTSQFKALTSKAFKGIAVDYDGNGTDDAFMIVPKVVYTVKGFTTKDEVKYVTCVSPDYSATMQSPVSHLTAVVEEGEIFVAAKVNNTVYVEKAVTVETYATGFGINGKVNLKNLGTVRYTNLTVSGSSVPEITENDIGPANIRRYTVYKNEIVCVTGQQSQYKFAVLCDVEKNGSVYTASLLVPRNGELVKEQLPLSASVAASLYSQYHSTTDGTTGKTLYKYTIVSGYQQTNDGYLLKINEAPNSDFVKVDKGVTLSYDSENCYFTLGSGNDAIERVFIDGTSSVFYKYTIESGKDAGFVNIRVYTDANIVKSDFSVTTVDTTYLVKADGCYVLIATMIPKPF